MTLTWILFYLLSVLTLLSGVLTIVRGSNPINSVVYLVSCFVSSALIFLLMGKSSLLGLILVIIYVGAIAILFIFVIMMMDLNEQDPSIFKSAQSPSFLSLSYAPGLIISLTVLHFFTKDSITNGSSNLGDSSFILSPLMTDFSTWEIAQRPFWDSLIQGSGSTVLHSIGYLLYTDFLSLLLLASLILLMVMIAVIAMVKD